jgi:hypothetical protein
MVQFVKQVTFQKAIRKVYLARLTNESKMQFEGLSFLPQVFGCSSPLWQSLEMSLLKVCPEPVVSHRLIMATEALDWAAIIWVTDHLLPALVLYDVNYVVWERERETLFFFYVIQ